MKYRYLHFSFFSIAFSIILINDPAISAKDLKNLKGCWQGTITYLDYSSNKPFSMPANMEVKDFRETNTIIYSMIYPKEPKANATDTIFISGDGTKVNGEMIISKKIFRKDSLLIITESKGIDGNDNKPATFRHSYLLGKHTYSTKKEVQFTGEAPWILRNEYRFRKIPCD